MTGRKEPVCFQGTIYKSFTDACKQLKVPYRTFINIRYKNPMLSVEEMLNMALKVVKTKRKYKSPATGKMVTSIAVLAKENNAVLPVIHHDKQRCSAGGSSQKTETD